MHARAQAVAELDAELTNFSYDGLVLLRRHLREGRVVRGSWSGCVMSYRHGRAGSVRRDHHGRPRNWFTTQWDGGWITDEEVVDRIDAEVARRRRKPAGAGLARAASVA
jgi:hypothetical protein